MLTLYTAVFFMTQCSVEQANQFINMTRGYSMIHEIDKLKKITKQVVINLTYKLYEVFIQYQYKFQIE